MQSSNGIGIVILLFVILIVVGPEKLPQSVEQIWLAIGNFRRQQANLEPQTLAEARKSWKATGSPLYALIGGLYQGAEHLGELRRRLMTTAIVFGLGTIAGFFFANPIFDLLKRSTGDLKINLIFVRPPEMILTYFKVALLCGVTLAMPLLVYQVLLFIYPAMESTRERRSFKLVAFAAVPTAFAFFVGGLAFAYFIMLPFGLRYLFQFGSEVAAPFWSISEFTNFTLSILFWIGIAFETPLIIFILAQMGVVTAKQLASKRKYAIVIVSVVAAVITPTPDPINMSLVLVPLYLLYELGILLARLAPKKAAPVAEN